MKPIFEGYKWQYHVKDERITMTALNDSGETIAIHQDLTADEVEEVLITEARAMKIRAEHWMRSVPPTAPGRLSHFRWGLHSPAGGG